MEIFGRIAMLSSMANKNELAVPTYLKHWRKYRNLTQEALAERVGLTSASISQLENGKQGFTDASLASLAGALGCTPADLLAYDPTRPDSFWPLIQAAERLQGAERRRAYSVIKAAIGLASAE